ncbi:MAG TPA: class I SAM-dependent methyltransferase [Myxococcota bacterium]|nr:class I SAM-dependent methyltransferase [Myxococcota bacterium]
MSRRLQCLAVQVPLQAKVVDVGTDHGLLPLWLLAQHRVAVAFGVDRSAEALAGARRNQQRFGLPLELRVGVGLSSVQREDFDCMTMAGMGAEEMMATLETCPPSLRWVGLQPHRGADQLRGWLHRRGWTVVGEQVVEEGGRFHPLLWALRGSDPDPLATADQSFGRLLLHQDRAALRRYLEAEQRRCTVPLLEGRGRDVALLLAQLAGSNGAPVEWKLSGNSGG